MSESCRSIEQHSLEFPRSLWGAIGQSTLHLGPYKFHWIELRGISWKPLHMESWITIEELIDRLPLMDESFVP
jgi:hypothetical protein